jgi:hypothetical protein
MAIGIQIATLDRKVDGEINVTCYDGHGFFVGDKVRFFNVMGGGTYPFMANNPYTVTQIGTVIMNGTDVAKPSMSFKVMQTGATEVATMTGTASISAGTPYGNSNQYYLITTSTPHGFSTQPSLKVKGVTSSALSSTQLDFINGGFGVDNVQIVNSTQLILRIARSLTGNPAITWTTGRIETWPTGMTVALDDGIRDWRTIGYGLSITPYNSKIKSKTEEQIVGALINLVQNSKGIDYPFLRLFNPMDVSQIGKARQKFYKGKIVTQAQTLRSALDLVIESFQQTDLKQRRYYINQDGQIVYEIKDDAQPATATAPYKIVTNSAGTPNTSSDAASVAPYSLEVSLDHDGTKRALFRTSTTLSGPISDLIKFDSPDAMGTAYTRIGSPYFDEIVDYPNGTGSSLTARQQAANSFFLERSAPVPSITFSLRGAGTASWNNLGFVSGYAQVTPLTSATTDIGYYWSVDGIVASNGTVTVRTWPLSNGAIPGMAIVVRGIPTPGFSGTFTVAGTTADAGFFPYSFTYLSPTAASQVANRNGNDDVSVTVYGLFARTGTAPNQIVTVTLPTQHKLATGAVVTVSGLTGAAGTSMNGSGTATVVDAYSFTYPSTGANGTATGVGTISAISLVPRWSPGQWVDISAAELGLTGLYRVEAVDWGFEPGSFMQRVNVTCNRRPSKTITKLMRKQLG